MAKKEELLKQAKDAGHDVNSRTTVAELESLLGTTKTDQTLEGPSFDVKDAGGKESEPTAEADDVKTVKVNENENGEATNGTTKDGSEAPVENTESVPQNGRDTVEVLETTDNEVATAADEARTKEEVQFADESNPNQKSRVNATDGDEYDQDGNPRTGGKSYGVADDDLTGFTLPEENKGKAPEDVDKEAFTGRVSASAVREGDFLNTDTNAGEWDVEEQQNVEEQLRDEENGITARVLTSTGDYVRIKFFRNNLAFGTYRSRKFDLSEAKKFLDRLKEQSGL